ncbi:hypothetical protein PIB30_114721, partial [Stylosanthes scabra]|nr:hypothetical protein [Stylosanthes scabra]
TTRAGECAEGGVRYSVGVATGPTAARAPRCRLGDTASVCPVLHPSVRRGISDARQVGQHGAYPVAPTAEGPRCMPPFIMGQRSPSLDV